MRTPGSTAATSGPGRIGLAALLTALTATAAAGCANDPGTRPTPTPSGASATATAGSSARNPCTLVTAEELADAVTTVKKRPVSLMLTESSVEAQGLRCEWTYPNEEAVTDTATILIIAWRGLRYYTPATRPDEFRPVADIGDAAHVSAARFMFRRGEDVFLVHVNGDKANDRIEPAIARLLVTKLV